MIMAKMIIMTVTFFMLAYVESYGNDIGNNAGDYCNNSNTLLMLRNANIMPVTITTRKIQKIFYMLF